MLVGVILPDSTADPRDPLGELGIARQDRRRAGRRHASCRRGSGPTPAPTSAAARRSEIAHLAMQHKADVVLFDNDLSPGQIGALEKIINEEAGSQRGEAASRCSTARELILDIFATRAQTHEAKLQVELAQMQYTYPRLTQMWGHLERIAGSGGGHGHRHARPGRNAARNRPPARPQAHRRSEGATSRRSRSARARLVAARNLEHFTVCIVGYTNAGKSTLFNTLTAAGTYADDKLFATLDTKTRAWKLERGTEVLLSDTVGFVRDLPHNLVASFKATLEEAVHADLLLHVLDVGHPHAEQQFKSVHEVLDEIGVKDKPEILLLNKIDTRRRRGRLSRSGGRCTPTRSRSAPRPARGSTSCRRPSIEAVRGTAGRRDARARRHQRPAARASSSRTRRIHDRQFTDGRVQLKAIMGKRTLADLSRNDQVEVKSAEPLG